METMNKITLEQLAVYLPYKLKIWRSGTTWPLTGLNNRVEFQLLSFGPHELNPIGCKPILRPLSDYADINGQAMMDLNWDLPKQLDLSSLALGIQAHWHLPYGSISMMAENHIDIFNWIPQGLAVNLNTIEK